MKLRIHSSAAIGSALIAAWLMHPSVAKGEPPDVPIFVLTHPTTACPEVGEFQARLLSRSSWLRPAREGETAVVYSLVVLSHDSQYAGSLSIREPNGQTEERTVEGTTCNGVVDALAFIAALLVEKQQYHPAPLHPAPKRPHQEGYCGLSTSIGISNATGPTLSPNPGVALILGLRGRSWAPEWQGGLRVLSPSRKGTNIGNAVFDGWFLHLSMSPLQWPSTGETFLRPTLGVEMGRLRGQGQQTVAPATVIVPWAAAKLGLQGAYQLAFPLSAFVEGAFVMPLSRHDFYFESPDGRQTPFGVPSLGFSGAIGLVAHLQ